MWVFYPVDPALNAALIYSNLASSQPCRYRVEAIPEQFANVPYKKRSSSHAHTSNLKSKTPKSTRPVPQPQAKAAAGGIAPCVHCAQQVTQRLNISKELQHEQQKTINLSKELESSKQKADAVSKVRCVYFSFVSS